jgi:hypothetical protein
MRGRISHILIMVGFLLAFSVVSIKARGNDDEDEGSSCIFLRCCNATNYDCIVISSPGEYSIPKGTLIELSYSAALIGCPWDIVFGIYYVNHNPSIIRKSPLGTRSPCPGIFETIEKISFYKAVKKGRAVITINIGEYQYDYVFNVY